MTSSPPSQSSSHSTSVMMMSVASSIAVGALAYWYHDRKVDSLNRKWEEIRSSERKGRIRAEVRLRTALKNVTETVDDTIATNNTTANNTTMTMQCIGTVVSPYTKRMGTPRQGALAPSSRGFVQLASNLPIESIDGMEQYSHGWIIFRFHANTDLASSNKTKVKPPRGNGIKVGHLATRSPHRPNPIGLSLVKIDRLDKSNRRLYISALDLVNGTPVYDIKPCVPWDIPGQYDTSMNSNSNSPRALIVPDWVQQDDAVPLQQVQLTTEAQQSLFRLLAEGRLGPLYTDAPDNNGYEAATKTLQEVLAQDPRASNRKGVRGTVMGKKEPSYRLIFASTQVEFQVLNSNASTAADEVAVQVVGIHAMDFSEDAYVDGIPLSSA